jgi:hypothetical protein
MATRLPQVSNHNLANMDTAGGTTAVDFATIDQ